MESMLICKICKKYLEHPIRLPCANTICNEHLLSVNENYECEFCSNKHKPDTFHFNNDLQQLINLNVHLNSTQSKAKNLINILEESIKDLEFTAKNFDNFLFDYFSTIRNKMDLRREHLKEQIDNHFNQINHKLTLYEKECRKYNEQELERIKIDKTTNDIELLKDKIRNPNIKNDETSLPIIIKNIESKIKQNEKSLIEIKNLLLKNKTCTFVPSSYDINENMFGFLDIRPNLFHSIECSKTLIGHLEAVNCIELVDPNILASGSSDRTIKLWNIQIGECIQTLKEHSSDVICLKKLLHTSHLLASGSWDSTIKIWDLNKFKCIKTLESHTKGVRCFTLSNKCELISGSKDNSIKIWNLNDFRLINTLKGHSQGITCLLVTQSNYLVSSSFDKTIKIWNLDTNQCTNTLIGHTDLVLCLDLSLNNRILSGSRDKTIKLWDIITGICLKTTETKSNICSLKVLSNDSFISGHASSQETMYLWHSNEHDCHLKLNEHTNTVFGLLSSETMKEIISCSADKSIKIWKIVEV